MTRHVGTATAATLVLASACAAAASQPKTPAIPPAAVSSLHGRIAYSTRGGDIWVMNAGGTGRRRVTRSGRGTDFDPDFSPRGRRLVFRTSRGRYAPDTQGVGLEGILVANVRTRRERQIQPRTGGLFPAWSPNGRKIAFSGLMEPAIRSIGCHSEGGYRSSTGTPNSPTVFFGSRARARVYQTVPCSTS